MKAAQIDQYGDQGVLQVATDATQPEAGPGEVLIEVAAAGVNPFDWKVRDGLMKDFISLTFPATLGGDVAGVVSQLGEGVTDFTVGQAVYGLANAAGGQGSFAEFTTVKAEQLADKPASVDSVTAAALPLAGTSAYQALVDHIGLQAGQKILVHGGAGGIGSFAIQLAKHRGAYVATTTAADDIDFVKSLGADEVIDYQTQDFSTLLKDYDAVFDTVGGETNAKSHKILKPGGTLLSMVAEPNEALAKQYGVHSIQQSSQATTQRLQEVAKLVDAGVLRAHIDKVFPLEEAAEALEYLKVNHPKGKVVLRVKTA